jgi:hypothetical protein
MDSKWEVARVVVASVGVAPHCLMGSQYWKASVGVAPVDPPASQ